LRAYIAQERPVSAGRQAGSVVAAAHSLTRFPMSGRAGRCPGTRELVVARTPLIIAYRLRADNIEILRVLHGRQRWPDTL
jgi:toxin ParE1/3/4